MRLRFDRGAREDIDLLMDSSKLVVTKKYFKACDLPKKLDKNQARAEPTELTIERCYRLNGNNSKSSCHGNNYGHNGKSKNKKKRRKTTTDEQHSISGFEG